MGRALTAVQLLEEARSLGVELWSEEGGLRFRAPKGTMTQKLRTRLRDLKAQLVELVCQQKDPEERYRGLCACLGKTVETPDGTGRLWQVFRDRVGVVLDGLPGRVVFYEPGYVHADDEKSICAAIETIGGRHA